MAEQYDVSGEAIGGAVELGVVGTLVGVIPSLPPAMVTVAMIGAVSALLLVSLFTQFLTREKSLIIF